mgnify:CR=1 FL=1
MHKFISIFVLLLCTFWVESNKPNFVIIYLDDLGYSQCARDPGHGCALAQLRVNGVWIKRCSLLLSLLAAAAVVAAAAATVALQQHCC